MSDHDHHEYTPITFDRPRWRKWVRHRLNVLFNYSGARVGAGWSSHVLRFNGMTGDDGEVAEIRFRQCPFCCALVWVNNEKFHEAWHQGGSV